MAKFCTNCGKELDENAAMCLNCGVLVGGTPNTTSNNTNKEKKKGLPTWAIVLIVVGAILLIPLIFIIVIGIFTYNVVKDAAGEFDINDYIEETVSQTGTIGDTLSTDDFKITLTDALIYSSIGDNEYLKDTPAEGKEYLVFFFEVENISDESQYISDYDFTGYADGYEVSNEYLYNDVNGISDLSATLSPNKKAKGYAAFEVDTTWQEFEVSYSDWFDNNELVFKVVNEDSSNVTGA